VTEARAAMAADNNVTLVRGWATRCMLSSRP
jgi:hypothetical protein